MRGLPACAEALTSSRTAPASAAPKNRVIRTEYPRSETTCAVWANESFGTKRGENALSLRRAARRLGLQLSRRSIQPRQGSNIRDFYALVAVFFKSAGIATAISPVFC